MKLFILIWAALASFAACGLFITTAIEEYKRIKKEIYDEKYDAISKRSPKMMITHSISENGHKIESKRHMTIYERIESGER